jgi:hypothetical protein
MKKSIVLLILLPIWSESAGQIPENTSPISGQDTNSQLGSSVSSSSDGTKVAFGEIGTSSYRGRVVLYQKDGSTYISMGSIQGESSVDEFGTSVSLSADGNRVAIGAPKNDGVNGANSGHVRVFEYIGGTNWIQVGADIDGENSGDRSGTSVSISADGTRVAIGAPQNDGSGANAGHVRIYEESGGIWSQVGSDLDGEFTGDLFGIAISLSADGTRIAVGAIENDDYITNAGHVRIFEETGDVWSQVGNDIDGEFAGDNSGQSVSLSADGTTVAIAAIKNDGTGINSGHVRALKETGGNWFQIGSDIDGESAGDQFGHDVSLSYDGTKLAISEIVRSSGTGRVRLYNNISGEWVLSEEVNGENEDDQFGFSVALTTDGNGLIIGAARAESSTDVVETNRGSGYIYYLETPLPVEWIRFEGKHENGSICLYWSTGSETNNMGFDIERSFDGKGWENFGYTVGNGNSSSNSEYTFCKEIESQQETYYRLKQIDFNGAFEYSNIILLPSNSSNEKINMFPNPTYGLIHFSGIEYHELIKILIYDQFGQTVKTFDRANEIEVYDLDHGIYFIELRIGETVWKERILIK